MDIVIRPTQVDAVKLTAMIIADTLRRNPAAVLGLATGRTFQPVYALLVEEFTEGRIDFSGVTTFNLDEYAGIAETDPRSFSAYMREQLFSKVNVSPDRCHLPDGTAADLAESCKAYESAIAAAGGIDLQLLGIGLTGHVGFNEPGSALHSRTRTKALSEITREQYRQYFNNGQEVPARAVTMGIGTILDAQRCLLLATGSEKSAVIAEALEGPITASVPASALQFHENCTVLLDEAAASRLNNTEYYLTTFAHEPEWAEYRERNL